MKKLTYLGIISLLCLALAGCEIKYIPCREGAWVDQGKVKSIYYQPRAWGAQEKWTVVTDKTEFETTNAPSYVIGDKIGHHEQICS